MSQKLRQIRDVSIGGNLRKLRKEAHMTQEQVVAQLQLRNQPTTRSTYSQIESGTYNIRISELVALAEIFHTDYNTIFDGVSYKK
ncbi:helix-turn-helix domain-containing protein [Anaerovorax odorimutans]|uniref:Helix-turn-helix domain-containing protein n=1 Tax=Anaerovorax odorimutans TaxID=109327 RepID=A0ABT1RLQ9_9FIRM|nr:helix-turn-helix transcriptional regulator [Anaerovorax odorimutans]MCQ4636107.1 helix-turn-helix domain-containing protein [Anaerovorax odorimutans]